MKEIGKTDNVKKEKTPRRSIKDDVKSEFASPQPANNSSRSSLLRKRKRKSEIEDMDDEEEDEDSPKTYTYNNPQNL